MMKNLFIVLLISQWNTNVYSSQHFETFSHTGYECGTKFGEKACTKYERDKRNKLRASKYCAGSKSKLGTIDTTLVIGSLGHSIFPPISAIQSCKIEGHGSTNGFVKINEKNLGNRKITTYECWKYSSCRHPEHGTESYLRPYLSQCEDREKILPKTCQVLMTAAGIDRFVTEVTQQIDHKFLEFVNQQEFYLSTLNDPTTLGCTIGDVATKRPASRFASIVTNLQTLYQSMTGHDWFPDKFTKEKCDERPVFMFEGKTCDDFTNFTDFMNHYRVGSKSENPEEQFFYKVCGAKWGYLNTRQWFVETIEKTNELHFDIEQRLEFWLEAEDYLGDIEILQSDLHDEIETLDQISR